VVKSLLSPRPDQTIKRLEALVDLARSTRQDGIDTVLGKVAETVRSVSGFRTIIFNVYHPAWDDLAVPGVTRTSLNVRRARRTDPEFA
jgi:hypothetical protein